VGLNHEFLEQGHAVMRDFSAKFDLWAQKRDEDKRYWGK